ncbi:MAG: hypothetical protein WBA39_29505 [Rivularia sp. (in: cyanobacteria)]
MQSRFDSIKDIWNSTGLSPVQGFFIVAGVLAVVTSYPSFIKHQARIENDKAALQKIEGQRRNLSRQFQAEQEQAKIANQRYATCLPVVGEQYQNGTHYFSGIQTGTVIFDRISNKPLPTGTVICDANGTTGVIGDKGAVTFTAFTGDRNVIQKRLKRFRGSQYSQPIVK